MSENTKIEWCDHTWSPWRGCTKVSPGCANCYAETLSKRNPAVLGQWGKGKPRVLNKDWNDPVKWNRNPFVAEHKWSPGLPESHRKTHRRRIFPSLCDWLDEEVDPRWLFDFLTLVLRKTPNLEWQLLTKRPEMFRERLLAAAATPTIDPLDVVDLIEAWVSGDRVPLNVIVGTSIEDQPRADERIPALLKIPARRRFLSVEPLIWSIDMKLHQIESASGYRHADNCGGFCDFACGGMEIRGGIDWVIVGGESGPGARPCNVEWIRDIVHQCAAAHVPCFVKQLGSNPVMEPGPISWPCSHPKGGDPAEWPEDLRVRQFPVTNHCA